MIRAISAGTIYTPREKIDEGMILIDSPRIVAVGPRRQITVPTGAEVVDHRDRIAVPGFIDLHIHGAAGHDLMEATYEAVSAVASYLARHGTTSFLATTITASLDHILNAARGLSRIVRRWQDADRVTGPPKPPGAQPIGIHFEGPFLNVEKRGAHPAQHIQKPSTDLLQRMQDAAEGVARVITMAPEVDGAIPVLQCACSQGLRVGIGHSNATYAEAERAIDAGASHATHVYNAMRPFLHRDPGILGAVLTDDRLAAELICDGIHVDPPAVRLLLKSKGAERVMLVTDSLSGAGMPDGEYPLGEFQIRVVDGACRTSEGTLAGSTLSLDAALRNLSRYTSLSFQECLPCATLNPAKLLGLEKQKGVIAPGADADLAILDQNYEVTQTYLGGQVATY